MRTWFGDLRNDSAVGHPSRLRRKDKSSSLDVAELSTHRERCEWTIVFLVSVNRTSSSSCPQPETQISFIYFISLFLRLSYSSLSHVFQESIMIQCLKYLLFVMN